MTYTPKVGDRVRVTHEGVVEQVHRKDGFFRVGGAGTGKTFTWFHPVDNEAVATVEKLQDPEPKWVNGDVIQSRGMRPIARVGGIWLEVENHIQIMDHEVSAAWERGNITTLLKANAA